MSIQHLISRLKALETEFLRLATADLPAERASTKTEYERRLNQLENAHSRSWFGDHSSTYYNSFHAPPPGHSFDVEWGFIPGYSGSRNSGWRIYSRDEVREFGEEIFFEMSILAENLTTQFSTARDQTLDLFEALSTKVNLRALARYTQTIENQLKPYNITDFINGRLKNAPRMTRDSEEIAKGQAVPAQVQYLAPFQSIDTNKRRATEFAGVLRNVIEATTLYDNSPTADDSTIRVFVGHGRSEQWRVLKDFIKERLGLEYEEFNRIPPAGIGTQERLVEMLQQCGFALLVMTGEDADSNGLLHPRENVIHESGLFQGKLGLRKAIVLLEEGCEEFSNIIGLGQIRFQKGNIASCFEEVRRVLEREGILTK